MSLLYYLNIDPFSCAGMEEWQQQKADMAAEDLICFVRSDMMNNDLTIAKTVTFKVWKSNKILVWQERKYFLFFFLSF